MWKKKRELNEDNSKKSPLLVISAGIFRFSSTIQPRPMPLDIDNGLPAIYMRFGTSDTDEATFCTHVNYCVEMNVGNIKIHQWIITTNPEILESYIQFDEENPFDTIRLNFALD